MRSTIGLPLWLLYATTMGETLVWLLSREASTSSTLAWEEVVTGGAGASTLWDGDMTTSAVAAFPAVECSDSQLESSTIAQISKLLTSAFRLILDFQGVLGVVAAGIACTLPSGGVLCSGTSVEVREYQSSCVGVCQ